MPHFLIECYNKRGNRRDVVVEASTALAAQNELAAEYDVVGEPEPIVTGSSSILPLVHEEVARSRALREAIQEKAKATAAKGGTDALWYIAALLVGIPGVLLALFFVLSMIGGLLHATGLN